MRTKIQIGDLVLLNINIFEFQDDHSEYALITDIFYNAHNSTIMYVVYTGNEMFSVYPDEFTLFQSVKK